MNDQPKFGLRELPVELPEVGSFNQHIRKEDPQKIAEAAGKEARDLAAERAEEERLR